MRDSYRFSYVAAFIKRQVFHQLKDVQIKALPETSLENNPDGLPFEYASGSVHNSRGRICAGQENVLSGIRLQRCTGRKCFHAQQKKIFLYV